MLRKSNCFVVTNTPNVEYLNKRVRVCITDLLTCHFEYLSTLSLRKDFIDENEEHNTVYYKPINAEPYFYYYNSYEIPDLLHSKH